MCWWMCHFAKPGAGIYQSRCWQLLASQCLYLPVLAQTIHRLTLWEKFALLPLEGESLFCGLSRPENHGLCHVQAIFEWQYGTRALLDVLSFSFLSEWSHGVLLATSSPSIRLAELRGQVGGLFWASRLGDPQSHLPQQSDWWCPERAQAFFALLSVRMLPSSPSGSVIPPR